jgi:hypothetical protein
VGRSNGRRDMVTMSRREWNTLLGFIGQLGERLHEFVDIVEEFSWRFDEDDLTEEEGEDDDDYPVAW